ncbi:serine-rich adhesin for platelets-like isoform X2 [Eurosta solidaginis]|uniref:serine-rich adhesin for platelets-like isoform X2 n=1 Tax=Eurosta solidaginis TaxID=178769 RepID=UPI00353104E1
MCTRGATLVEEEDFNELTAVPTATIVIATNANGGKVRVSAHTTTTANGSASKRRTGRQLPAPLKLTSSTSTSSPITPTKSLFELTQHYTTAPTNAGVLTTQASEESQPPELTPLTEAFNKSHSPTTPTSSSHTNTVSSTQRSNSTAIANSISPTASIGGVVATQFGGGLTPAANSTATIGVANAPSNYGQQSSVPAAPTVPPPTFVPAAATAATTTTYSHNSKTTRSWPVIYRNPHHYDYEALYVQTKPTALGVGHHYHQQPANHYQLGSAAFKQNCYSNQFAQSILYNSSNEDLSAINEHVGSAFVGFNGVGSGGAPGGNTTFGNALNNYNNNTNSNNTQQTTCYYFTPSRHNSIYEHPSSVVHNTQTLQFDPTAATTAATAAAVENLRRSNSILLRNSNCAKALNQSGGTDGLGGGVDLGTPTSLNSGMDMGSNADASACCANCCMGPPPVLFLFVTLLMTTSATAMLCAAIMTDHWEHVTWDRNSLDRYTNRSGMQLEWMLNEKVAMLKPDKKAEYRFRREAVFLVPMHGGIWTLCIDLPMQELQELRRHPKFPRSAPPCVNYLAGSMENARGEEQRNDWQHRMQNLSISCSLVCLIILGSAALVGAFGVCQRQISAILITGVMYLLAALFALFTLMIIHFKRQQGRPMLDSDYDGTVDGIVARPGGVAIMAKPLLGARIFLTSWSLDFGWGGVVLCGITSVLWILLSKIMRYNPFSALMI